MGCLCITQEVQELKAEQNFHDFIASFDVAAHPGQGRACRAVDKCVLELFPIFKRKKQLISLQIIGKDGNESGLKIT